MGLYSSLSLVGAMAVSALIAIWLFYKRSHRDDFPEETWDPYFDKNQIGGGENPEREIEDISGRGAGDAAAPGLEPASENPPVPASNALEDRIRGLRDEMSSPGEDTDEVYEFGDSKNPVPEFDLGLDDQVEQIGGGPVSPEKPDTDRETADLAYAAGEAEDDFSVPGSPIETPAHPQGVSSGFGGPEDFEPDLNEKAAASSPGVPWWEGLPAAKEVVFQRGVAELMGMTVIDPPGRAEAGPGEASTLEASTLEASPPETSALEASETFNMPGDMAADSIPPEGVDEAEEPPAPEFAGAPPFGEEDSETPRSFEEEAFEEDESPVPAPAPEEQPPGEPVSISDESVPTQEIPAVDEGDESSFTLDSLSFGDEPDEAPVMYEAESATNRAEDGGFAEPGVDQEDVAGEGLAPKEPAFEESSEQVSLTSEPVPEEPVGAPENLSESPSPGESASTQEIPAVDEGDGSSFTLDSLSFGDEPDEAPVMYEAESAPAPVGEEEISLSSPSDSESSEAIGNFLAETEPPPSAPGAPGAESDFVDDEIEPAQETVTEGEISPEPEDESFSSLGESEEKPMAFDLAAEGSEFIDSDESAQELPTDLGDEKFASHEPEEFSAASTGPVEPAGLGAEESAPGDELEKISKDSAEAILDPEELEEETEPEEEPAGAGSEPVQTEEASTGAVLDPMEMEEEPPERAIDSESFEAEPAPHSFVQPDDALPAAEPEGPAPEGPVSEEPEPPEPVSGGYVPEESLDVFSVLEQERSETPESMPQESIGNAALFEDFGDERAEPPEPHAAGWGGDPAGAGGDSEDASRREFDSEEIPAQSEEVEAEPPREGKIPAEEALEPAISPRPAPPSLPAITPLTGGSMPEIVRNFIANYCPDDLLLIEEEWDTLPGGIDKVAASAWKDIQERLEARQEVDEAEFLRIGLLEYLMGDHDAALAHLKESLRRAKRMGPVLNALGATSFARGKIDPAISYCREAVREAGPDMKMLVAINRNLGVLYQTKGEFGRAAEAIASAIKFVRSEGSPGMLANLHLRAGQLFRKLGDAEAARHHLSESAHLFLRAGDDAARIRSLVALAAAQTRLNEIDEALKNLNEAALMCRRAGDKNGEALVMGQMGIAYSAQEQYTRALEFYENAISLNRELENRKGEGANLSNIGNIHYFRGDFDEALSAYDEALVINIEQDHLIGQATIMGNLGRIYLEQGRVEEAIARLKESLEIFKPFAADSQMENIREMLAEAARTRDQ